REKYLRMIQKAISELNSGNLKKVVLSRKVNVEQHVVPLELYLKVLAAYPKAFCYIWYHPKVGTWIGATPEILIKSEGREFTTMSLAGTQSVEEYPQPQWTSKELNEQRMVTDYISDAMKNTSITVKTSDVESIKAGNLWHLRTKLSGRFEPGQFESILKAIHPTPAVCGIPMQNAKDFIRQNENYDRSFYTGFLGELNFKKEHSRNRNRKNQENSAYKTVQNTSELFVNLRCMQIFKERVEIYVGGGITSESKAELEWEETVNKSKTMFKVLLT
ncbi:MAG: chorismate-binding protein, partial [Maribacter sp.]